MTAAAYFGGEVAKLADQIATDANWQAMFDKEKNYLTMGWRASTRARAGRAGRTNPSTLALV